MSSSDYPNQPPDLSSMSVKVEMGCNSLAGNSGQITKRVVRENDSINPPSKRQRLPRRVIDPAEDSKILGADGKPIRLIIGYWDMDITVLIYAKRRRVERLGLTYSMSKADFEASKLTRNIVAFSSIKLLPQYYHKDVTQVKSKVMAGLSGTDTTLSNIDRARGQKYASKLLVGREEGGDKESEDEESGDESFDEGEDLANDAKQFRSTRSSRKIYDGFYSEQESTEDIRSPFLNSVTQIGASLVAAVQKKHEDKTRTLQIQHDKDLAEVRESLKNSESSNEKLRKQHNRNLDEARERLESLEAQNENLQKQLQLAKDQIKTLEMSQGTVEVGGPRVTTVMIKGIKHTVMEGYNEGYLRAPRDPRIREWDGKSWVHYQVRYRTIQNKPFCLDPELEEKLVVVDGISYREIETKNGMRKRIAVEEEIETDKDGNQWVVNMVRNQIPVEDF